MFWEFEMFKYLIFVDGKILLLALEHQSVQTWELVDWLMRLWRHHCWNQWESKSKWLDLLVLFDLWMSIFFRPNLEILFFFCLIIGINVSYGQVDSGDLVAYGLIPEFIGRFPILVSLSALNEDQLVQVCSIFWWYTRLTSSCV